MESRVVPVALLYDDSAYVETLRRRQAGPEASTGLVGREVAGREFLDAYLSHGRWDELTGVVYNQPSANSLTRFFQEHPSGRGKGGRLRVVPLADFPESFFPDPPAPVFFTPCPPDPAFAWARYQGGPESFALCGVTHTLCTTGAARVLCDLLTAPYEPYDALICTSTAVVKLVQACTGAYADYLRERLGVRPTLRPRLVMIPLGVNPEKFRPATVAERAARRAALHITDDEVAVLFVGRFAPHAKAHPFSLFHGLARAARETGQRVHLVLCGWAANDSLLHAYVDGARAFAPGIPVSVVNGLDPDLRFGVWKAADLFTSLPDNLQETFGLVVLEGMASGLPLVASDWDGYRDLVAEGETGLLVPTCMVQGATGDATLRLLLGAVDYDTFLAECNQAVAVDPEAAAAAYARLLCDAELRRRMGHAGRARVLERFTWAGVVRAYEELWRSQDEERRAAPVTAARLFGPACFPAPELAYAGYPTRWLGDEARLETVPGAADNLGALLALPLTNYAGGRRVTDESQLRALLAEAASPRPLAELDAVFQGQGISPVRGRATVAWLLKYGLLRVARE
jgi:glycosyltransferase involved in cell wall biosynthesis